MLNEGYFVVFHLLSGGTEEYFYHKEADARYHFGLFTDDDFDIYSCIDLIHNDTLLDSKTF